MSSQLEGGGYLSIENGVKIGREVDGKKWFYGCLSFVIFYLKLGWS